MDLATIARWRMQCHGVWGPPRFTSATDVLVDFAASQGQDLTPAMWGLSQRAGMVTEASIQDECDDGTVLRTHVLRPTWHFVHRDDLRWLLTATAPRVHRINGTIYRQWGFDEATFATIRGTIETLMADGQHRTRTEVGEALAAAGLPLKGQGLAYALMYAELEGILVSGRRRGKQQTYALLDERSPGPDDRDREAALHELATRYYRSRGPASERDLAAWASLTLAEVRRATASAAGDLGSFEHDGITYWHSPDVPPLEQPCEPRVDLMQGLDELVMSYSHTRGALLGGVDWEASAPHSYFHAILLDGQVGGFWTYERASDGRITHLLLHLLADWAPTQRAALDDAIERFCRYTETEVTRDVQVG